jgi:hypothetical protein
MAYFYGVTKKDKDSINIDLLSERFVKTLSFGFFIEKEEK